MTYVLKPPLVLMVILELFYGPGNFWPGNYPTPHVSWIVSKTDYCIIFFDACVILFMRLVDWDRREHLRRFPYSKVASPKLSVYI